MSDLSEYANFVLRSLADKSDLSKRIVVTPMEPLYYNSEKEMSQIFGPPHSASFDGIHPKGKLGKKLYNNCLISAIRMAGIAPVREVVQVEEAAPTPTSNMFEGLN